MNKINIEKGGTFQADAVDAPDYRLFSAGQIAVGAVLGSVITGGLMLASNYAKLGDKKKMRRTITFAVGVFFLFSIIGVIINFIGGTASDEKAVTGMLNVISIITFGLLLNRFQGVQYDNHTASGGERASNLNVVAYVAVISVLYIAAFILFQMFIEFVL